MNVHLNLLQGMTFLVLALSIVALWFRGLTWVWLFVASIAVGLVANVLMPISIVWISALGVACYFYRNRQGFIKWIGAGAIILLSLALGLHRLPGFHNPLLLSQIVLSQGAAPYDLYWNFDKTVAGILIVGLVARPTRVDLSKWVKMLGLIAPVVVINVAVITILSLSLGYLKFDPKWNAIFWSWAFSNLFLTCLSEEAFFRGFVQGGIAEALARNKIGGAVAMAVGAILFGIAHFAGGWTYVLLATLAGIGYGLIYKRSERIEFAILGHFFLNTTHFLLFTYPTIA